MTTDPADRIWRIRAPKYGFEWEGPLVARWEAHLDPISDNYTTDEISARELLLKWAKQAGDAHPDGLVPIAWFVESPGHGKFERMPFQHAPADDQQEDFLTHYDWPEDPTTAEPINWLKIAVADKAWNATVANKGGFIQEATGWKPSILQPFLYLPGLLAGAGF